MDVEQFILFFKCLAILIIYLYSVYIKFYRESNSNFSNQSDGLKKVIESMKRKIV